MASSSSIMDVDAQGIDTVRDWLKNGKVVDLKMVSGHFKVILYIEISPEYILRKGS